MLMKKVYLKKQKGNQMEKIICFANRALPKEAEHRDVILPREITQILTTAFRRDLTRSNPFDFFSFGRKNLP